MDERTVGQVEEWDSRPFEGGYDGLHNLADEGFTGAVTAAGAWLFMLNGRVIGVFNGRLDDFEHGSGTTYRAPHPSLPLLFTMLEEGGETQAQYFTDDNSIDEVDETLTEANFTGYLELSENVLSGDYYVAYYGGRSLSAAFVGNSEQLITGDEAFQRAVDEVGIYEVIDVDLEIHELPERDTSSAAASDADSSSMSGEPETAPAESPTGPDSSVGSDPTDTATGTGSSATDSDTQSSPPPTDTEDPSGPPEPVSSPESGEAIEEAEPASSPTDQSTEETDPPSTDSQSTPPTAGSEPADPTAGQTDRAASQPDSTVRSEGSPPPETEESSSSSQDRPQSQPTDPDSSADRSEARDTTNRPPESDAPEDAESPFSEEEQWRETRDVPALDPNESEPTDDTTTESRETAQSRRSNQEQPAGATASNTDTTDSQPADSSPKTPQGTNGPQASGDSGPIRADNAEKIRNLRTQLEERTAELESVRQELLATKEERDQLQEERDGLKQRIQTLEAELEKARERVTDTGPAASEMSPEEALEQTDIFIRYGSKGNATLEKAHQGQADKGEVTANLKLEHHTRFDTDSVTVGGEPFETFLQDTMEYQFTKWVVEDLLFELQETGSHGKLQDLYDVLPRFDRSELRGTVELRNEDGEEIHETFDIVVRDRMGQPLIVVNINDSRDPATSEMMEELIEAATNVKLANDTLGAAVEVTASFFKPDALETASEATSSGLLSRDRRASYIKINRKQGYHLCLVEARNGAFHVNVPEL